MLFAKKTNVFVGLAIQDNSLSLIKLCQLTRRQPLLLEAFSCEGVPDGGVNGEEISFSELFIAALKKQVAQLQLEHCCVAVALPALQMINKRIKIASALNELERHAEVLHNLDYYLPGVQQKLNIDFVKLSHQADQDELLLVAARTEQIHSWVKLMKQVNLHLTTIDVDAYAIVRATLWPVIDSPQQILILVIDTICSARLVLVGKMGIAIMAYIYFQHAEECVEQIKKTMQRMLGLDEFSIIQKIYLLENGETPHSLTDKLHDEWLCSIERVNLFSQVELANNVDIEKLKENVNGLLVAYGLALRGFCHDSA